MTAIAELVKHPKGSRPQFFPDPATDKLLAMVMALAGEVAVIRDRLDTFERLVEAKGVVTRNDIENYKPSKEVHAERDAWREEYLSHILRIVDLDADAMDRNDLSPKWEKMVETINK